MKPIQLASPIKIWYKPLPGVIRTGWPIVDLRLCWKERSLPQPVLSLVDSGADCSILHKEVAEVLGFDFKELGAPLYTGKSVSGFYKSWKLPDPIDVNIYGFEFAFSFCVIDNPDLNWPCILGEDTIFNVAKLDFQKFKGYFEIRFREDIN